MKSMTPSKAMTEGNVSKAVSNYRAMLEKYAPKFSSSAVQDVLGDSAFAQEQFEVFQRRVNAISNMIIRHVKVDRSINPEQATMATHRRVCRRDQYIVDHMPKGAGNEVEVVFFKPDPSVYCEGDGQLIHDGLMSTRELAKQYELRRLTPVDPYTLCAVNAADLTFADDHPNATYWKDGSGKYCCMNSSSLRGEWILVVEYCWPMTWSDKSQWFAGFRKK